MRMIKCFGGLLGEYPDVGVEFQYEEFSGCVDDGEFEIETTRLFTYRKTQVAFGGKQQLIYLREDVTVDKAEINYKKLLSLI